MGALSVFPLMIIPVVIYNLLALTGQALTTVDQMRLRLDTDFLSVPMSSGVVWSITPGHALTGLALVCLFFELIKSTGTGRAAVMNHAFSLVLFVLCLVQFLLMPAFATSVFFLIGTMALLDVLAGFMVTIASARRDIGVDGAFAD
ncbi:hypothetical protein [uncultured Algimonas sp.]|uniref:hypothetical protein n=1 Tax=uncultured Algimonas sp. TaxID=1547920 RepID=UPI00261013A1|nr:hypothetical protein [uncultured Algimonas sp.]